MLRASLQLWLLVTFLAGACPVSAAPPKEDHSRSPHAEALVLVFTTQQKVIAELDTENWWHDVKPRQWVVKRPFHPGIYDSTHLFEVTYRIDEKEVASWLVDTGKKSVLRGGIAGANQEK